MHAELDSKALLSDLESRLDRLRSPRPAEVYEVAVGFLRERVPHYNWVGVYVVEGKELVLAAWVGKHATEHVRIPIGAGICGLAARTGSTVNVPDVAKDDRYLSCFADTKSELVVPIWWDGDVVGEIDIDSDTLGSFTKWDEEFVEDVAELLADYV
ncbi:MAG: GAF domain-containing protein [Methanobacteriota archaeon]